MIKEIIVFIVLSFLLFLITPWLCGLKARKPLVLWCFHLVHAIILTGATLFYFNSPSEVSNEQIGLMRWINGRFNLERINANQYVDNNFIFINNSFSKVLVPTTEIGSSEGSVQPISDRENLLEFLNLISANLTWIDLVICDMGFEKTTPVDPSLSSVFTKLAKKNKLLVSIAQRENKVIRNLPDSIKGDVVEQVEDNRFTVHTLFDEARHSLAYKVYQRLDGVRALYSSNKLLVEQKSNRRRYLCLNNFLPKLYIDDQVYNPEGTDVEDRQTVQIIESSSMIMRNLESFADSSTRNDFVSDLKQRKMDRKRNVLFLGAYYGDEDFHETTTNRLHGPMIILNMFYNLHQGNHHLSFALLIGLINGFFVLSWMLTSRLSVSHFSLKFPPHKIFIVFLPVFWSFLLDNYFYLLYLIFLILIVNSLNGLLINVLGLVFYCVAFRTFFVFISKRYLELYESQNNI